MTTRLPPLLEPYLSLPPESSLILLTSVLGASSNWLILRFLYSALNTPPSPTSGDETKVLLVSFMRDLAFWKENAKRLGLDLEKFMVKKRFGFVDGLSGLFLPKKGKENPGTVVLSNSELSSVFTEIQNAVKALQDPEGGSKVLLVVDQLDFLMAAGGEKVNAVELGDMIMGLREEVHATVMAISADQSLVSHPRTPLEVDHAAFLLSVAHQADLIMGLRLLDSGTARDVSGVVRITAGGSGGEEEGDGHQKIEEKELLYFVGGDGGVKVFERGQ